MANSNAMEKEGFSRLMDKIIGEGVTIEEVSTDRHLQIRKLMTSEKYKEIKHSIDPWHLIKSLKKKLKAKSKNKDCEIIGRCHYVMIYLFGLSYLTQFI